MKGVLSFTDEELVSADFIHNVTLGSATVRVGCRPVGQGIPGFPFPSGVGGKRKAQFFGISAFPIELISHFAQFILTPQS